jgi:hypothetical protein
MREKDGQHASASSSASPSKRASAHAGGRGTGDATRERFGGRILGVGSASVLSPGGGRLRCMRERGDTDTSRGSSTLDTDSDELADVSGGGDREEDEVGEGSMAENRAKIEVRARRRCVLFQGACAPPAVSGGAEARPRGDVDVCRSRRCSHAPPILRIRKQTRTFFILPLA